MKKRKASLELTAEFEKINDTQTEMQLSIAINGDGNDLAEMIFEATQKHKMFEELIMTVAKQVALEDLKKRFLKQDLEEEPDVCDDPDCDCQKFDEAVDPLELSNLFKGLRPDTEA